MSDKRAPSRAMAARECEPSGVRPVADHALLDDLTKHVWGRLRASLASGDISDADFLAAGAPLVEAMKLESAGLKTELAKLRGDAHGMVAARDDYLSLCTASPLLPDAVRARASEALQIQRRQCLNSLVRLLRGQRSGRVAPSSQSRTLTLRRSSPRQRGSRRVAGRPSARGRP
jgi:hypothetical protein